MRKLDKVLNRTTEIRDVTNWNYQRELPLRCGEYIKADATLLLYLLNEEGTLYQIGLDASPS